MRNLLLCLVVLILISCNDGGKFFSAPCENKKEISIDTISFLCDSIILGSTSYNGFTSIFNDKIFFLDRYLCWLYEFDKELRFVKRHCGQGRGPQELPFREIDGYAIDGNGNHFVCSDRVLLKLSANFDDKKQLPFLPNDENNSDVFKMSSTYGLLYGDLCFKIFENYVYFNVMGITDEVNPMSSNEWYKQSRIIMQVDEKTGKITDLLGRVSPSTPRSTSFLWYTFDIDYNGDFYIKYESDTLIYKYDKNYNFIKSFGYDGIGVNRNYKKISSDSDIEISEIMERERTEKGYFTSLSIVNSYLFRTYRTGGEHNQNRMQVYRDDILIGDVLIPEPFKVIGYIAPYYYSNVICDEDNERMLVYRFKLN